MNKKPKKVAKGSAAEQSTRTGVGKSGRSPTNKVEKGASRTKRPPCEKCGQVHTKCGGHTKHGPNTGKPCGANPRRGQLQCIKHGGNHPAQIKSGKQRLLEMVNPALAELQKIVMNPDTDDSVKVRSIQIILDRTGYGPGQTLVLETSEWDATTDAMLQDLMDANNGVLPINRDLSSFADPVGGGGRQPVNIQRDDDFDWPNGDVVEGEIIEDGEETFPAKSRQNREDAARQTIWGDDGVKRNIGASEFDPSKSGPYESGPLTKEERLARDLEDGQPPRNQTRQR